MPHSGSINVTVLWAHELRLAAQTLRVWRELSKDAGEEERADALYNLVKACDSALIGVEDGAALIVCEPPKGRMNSRTPTPDPSHQGRGETADGGGRAQGEGE